MRAAAILHKVGGLCVSCNSSAHQKMHIPLASSLVVAQVRRPGHHGGTGGDPYNPFMCPERVVMSAATGFIWVAKGVYLPFIEGANGSHVVWQGMGAWIW